MMPGESAERGRMSQRRKPTSEDVARLAQVSRQTVNRVLGGYGYSSATAVERVKAAAAELGYRPNDAARSLLRGRTQTIGLVVVSIEIPFFARIVDAFTEVVQKAGYDTFVMSSKGSDERETHAVETLLAKNVEGIVLAPTDSHYGESVERILNAGIPLVTIDRAQPNALFDSVSIDNVKAGQSATKYLLDGGRREIALVGFAQSDAERNWQSWDLDDPPSDLNPSAARLLGYLLAHRAAGLPVTSDRVELAEELRPAVARAAAQRALDANPDAVFATDDVCSVATVEMVQRRKISVPDDLWVVGFDDALWTRLASPSVTVMHQSAKSMGRLAAERLLLRMRGGGEPGSESFVLPCELVVRDSTAQFHPRRDPDANSAAPTADGSASELNVSSASA